MKRKSRAGTHIRPTLHPKGPLESIYVGKEATLECYRVAPVAANIPSNLGRHGEAKCKTVLKSQSKGHLQAVQLIELILRLVACSTVCA